jgi:aldehyde:ferredoxin oxidoreductase
MMKGFYNRYLLVNVSTGTSTVEPIDESVLKAYLGGKGLGTWLLLKHQPAGVEPLAPENPLIIGTGPANGSPVYGSSRIGVYTKSPLTGVYLGSYTGGKVPERIAQTGFDAIVLIGRRDALCYVEITPSGALFHDASALKGMDCHATEKLLNELYGKASGSMVIGPAGENGIPFALMSNDLWRCAGRGGAGAVLGSKNVKALVFSGSAQKQLGDPEAAQAFARATLESKKDHPVTKAYKLKGTPMLVDIMSHLKAFPTRYWRQGFYEGCSEINSDAMYRRMDVHPHACAKCFIACGKLATVKDGPYAGLKIEGPEYETIYAFGGLCMIDDITEIAYLNDLCDRLGVDTITAGNLVALAMEASEQGKLDEKIAYGDTEAAAALIHAIVERRGLGAILAKGIRSAARVFGMESEAIHVKGMEPAGYDPRYLKGMGLAYATSDRGACHLRSTFYKAELSGIVKPEVIEGKVPVFLDFEDRLTIADTLVLCRFYRDFYQWDELLEIVRVTTGESLTKDELRQIASNVIDLVRQYNHREGVTEKDDSLPKRFFSEQLPEGGYSITEEEFDQLKSEYYHARGWSKEGIPMNARL